MSVNGICNHRITIITGHYGTGKTEFSVNLALALALENHRVMLADLDIVNPYFRSRDRKRTLKEHGIRLISSSQACTDADVPALPAELLTIFENKDVTGILDVGGDPAGARVLARFQPEIACEDYQMLYVFNANRPEVRDPNDAVHYLRNIEAITGLSCTGLINNTHLCGETTPGDIQKGAQLAAVISQKTNIRILCHVAEERLIPLLPGFSETVFPITIQMKKPWEL